jgi:lipopolysaccharide biosynthesis regulator YciM
MQFDIIWLLLTMPLAFVLGWLASRFDFQQLRLQNRRSPKAYFRGLNHLLRGENDAAVAEFERAVRNDPDTPELQFALGHLFRERGQYSPAVRLHEHLLMRADLGQSERDRAQHALAMDYSRAGILDRAEAALLRLEGTAHQSYGRQIRLAIYERLRDWQQAATVAQALLGENQQIYTRRLSHYWCEQAQQMQPAQTPAALALLQRAHESDPQAPRPLVEKAKLALATQAYAEAAAAFHALQQLNPDWLALVADDFSQAWNLNQNGLQAHLNLPEQLSKIYQNSPSIDLLQAWLTVQTPAAPAQDASAVAAASYLGHLQRKPSLVATTRWLEAKADGMHTLLPPEVVRALQKTAQPLLRYRCTACGFEGQRHYWHCPGCQAWDAYAPLRVEDL